LSAEAASVASTSAQVPDLRAQVQHLQADNARLVRLLATTAEYKKFMRCGCVCDMDLARVSCVHVFMCSCVHVFMCSCIHVFMCSCVHMFTCSRAHVFTCIHVHMYAWACQVRVCCACACVSACACFSALAHASTALPCHGAAFLVCVCACVCKLRSHSFPVKGDGSGRGRSVYLPPADTVVLEGLDEFLGGSIDIDGDVAGSAGSAHGLSMEWADVEAHAKWVGLQGFLSRVRCAVQSLPCRRVVCALLGRGGALHGCALRCTAKRCAALFTA
jgi:hypothetical protein